nr:hypothetical protein [uncultured Methanoregula sp.]
MLTSATFYDCDRKIRPFFENRVQFAALQDSKRFLDTLIYFISIIGFVFPLLVILYGTISNFNIFSIIFTISFCFIIIWQINIINNMPRNIFNIKLKDNRNICEGIVLTKLDTEIIQISVQDTINNKKIIHIPRTSIEYISLNRTIKKTDFINPPVSYLQAILSLWNSLKTLKNFLLTFICFDLGFFTGLILFLGVAILTSYLPIPEQLLIIVFLIFSFSFGFFYGRLYTPLIDNVSGKILSLTNFMETSKNFLVTLIDFKLGFLAGSIFFLAIAVFNTDFKELPPQWLTLIIFIIVLIIGFFYGRYHQSSIVVPTLGPVQLSEVVRYPEDIRPPEEMDSENWRSYYAYNDELTNIQYPEEIHPPVDVNSENWRRYYAYNDDLMRK